MLRKTFLAFLLLLGLSLLHSGSAFAQAKDKIEGRWFNEEKTAKVEIYKAIDGKYWGKIVWLKEPDKDGKPRVDEKNPVASRRSFPIMGLPILKSFVKDGENTYTGGKIYDPKNGKTYDCKITWRNANQLDIRGYVGVSMLGRTTSWTRAD